MDVGRLQKFEGKITAQGKLLLHGTIFCGETSGGERNTSSMQKPKELQVFLFEQNIIFSDINGKKTQFTNPSYIYKSHIQVGDHQWTLCDLMINKPCPFLGEQNDADRKWWRSRQALHHLVHRSPACRHQLHMHCANAWSTQRVDAHHQSPAPKAIRFRECDKESDWLHQEDGQHQE